MKKSILYFESKKIENLSSNLVGGRNIETGGGSLHVCDGKELLYGSDVKKVDRWFFSDSIKYNFIDIS